METIASCNTYSQSQLIWNSNIFKIYSEFYFLLTQIGVLQNVCKKIFSFLLDEQKF